MKPARYIFVNRGLGMSPGKIAAQAAHAETLAMAEYFGGFSLSEEWTENQKSLFDKWYGDGHYTKYVMLAEDTEQIRTIETYLTARNFKTYLVIDEGRTEGTYMVPTAMSVELVDKDDQRITSIFSTFKTYREKSLPRDASQSEVNGFGFTTFLGAMKRGKTH